MIIQSLFYIPTIIALLALAVLIFFKNRKETINQIFALFLLVTAIWLLVTFFGDITNEPKMALFLARTVKFIDPFLAYIFLVFSVVFPFKVGSNKILYVFLIPTIVLSLFSYHPSYIPGVNTSGLSAIPTEVTTLQNLYLVYNIVYFGLAFILLLWKLSLSTIDQKYQIRLVIFGTFTAIFLSIAYLKIPQYISPNSPLQFLSVPTILLATLVIAQAVQGHRLFDIRLVLASSVIYVAHYLSKHKSCTRGLYEIQTAVFESSSKHIALDFTDVGKLDTDTVRSLINIKKNAQRDGKKLFFIRYQHNLLR